MAGGKAQNCRRKCKIARKNGEYTSRNLENESKIAANPFTSGRNHMAQFSVFNPQKPEQQKDMSNGPRFVIQFRVERNSEPITKKNRICHAKVGRR